MPHPLAARIDAIEPFHVMRILERAHQLSAAGHDVIHLEVGEPDFATPQPIVDAGIRALQDGRTYYTPAAGIPALREAIAGHYWQRFGVKVDPARIIVTPGASGALLLALAALIGRDDEVLLTDPGYPCNRHFVALLEGRAVNIPVGPQTAYQLDETLLTRHWTPRSQAALVASPSNPTGTLLPNPAIARLNTAIRLRGGRLIVDEIYQGLVYDAPNETALAVSDELFVVNSFSKYFQMTGWRLGWLVVPTDYIPAIEKLAQNLFLSPPTVAQYAALAAFSADTHAIIEARRQILASRRDLLVAGLRRLGFSIPLMPEGAFYVWANCAALGDGEALAERLLEHAHVAITPGLDFCLHQPGDYVRFAYTTDADRIEEALLRVAKLIDARP
ncbi:pyridoxal phosphate-dependent aminotransferase [Parachitinimonas caeni]|uniref:Putative 8-amino-7-oxononanoate synthase n=1 Tax=Parachitinimonas caeni TaxID=3031301 RepID=A0ABT7DWZ5_9NEIS|nr:pyridoxal phosphate-dependent aminotransferase [Parachitinimonas caeni]MDK2124588.1 pyridoxal phosphate-dependent aminotransferase [Parachitinimonas caeni]